MIDANQWLVPVSPSPGCCTCAFQRRSNITPMRSISPQNLSGDGQHFLTAVKRVAFRYVYAPCFCACAFFRRRIRILKHFRSDGSPRNQTPTSFRGDTLFADHKCKEAAALYNDGKMRQVVQTAPYRLFSLRLDESPFFSVLATSVSLDGCSCAAWVQKYDLHQTPRPDIPCTQRDCNRLSSPKSELLKVTRNLTFVLQNRF